MLPGINSAEREQMALTLGNRLMRVHPPERPQLHSLGLGRWTEGTELHNQLLGSIEQPAFSAVRVKGTMGGSSRTTLHTQHA